MIDDYFFEPLKVYVVSENANYTRKQAQELAKNNKRKAGVFWILYGSPRGTHGILFLPDGTARETTLQGVARLRMEEKVNTCSTTPRTKNRRKKYPASRPHS
jgi:hypothetical protein